MAKSVTGALVGLAIEEGRLALRAPAPVAAWRAPGDPRGAITLDQLLRMSSGLAFSEVYGPGSDATRMLYLEPDMGGFAATKALAAEPDARWSYSSGTTNLLARILREATGGELGDAWAFAFSHLFAPLGMESAVFETDESGSFVGSSYFFATARDWARFGQLFLQDGVWRGRRILPAGWVAYATTPTAAAPRGRYGAQWWLNAGEPGDPEDREWPLLPRDAACARGHSGQYVLVIPSHELVVVRLGLSHRGADHGAEELVGAVIDALPSLSAAGAG
jgi:CubicO group peptidase (beta-lactamase class C family)